VNEPTTTPEPPALPPVRQEDIDTALSGLRSELARCDSKASLLLALTGAVLAGVLSAAANTDLPTAAVVAGAVGVAGLFAATMLLLAVVRPRLGGCGWPTWHRLTIQELHARLADGQLVNEVRILSVSAVRKFTGIQRAVDCIRAGLVFLAVAGVLTAVLGGGR
jgi:hypothetical protein